jgi:hypothetical protein
VVGPALAADARRANRYLTKSNLEGAPIPHPRQLCFLTQTGAAVKSRSLLRRKGSDVTRAIVLLLQTLATRRRLHFNELPMAANDGPDV